MKLVKNKKVLQKILQLLYNLINLIIIIKIPHKFFLKQTKLNNRYNNRISYQGKILLKKNKIHKNLTNY